MLKSVESIKELKEEIAKLTTDIKIDQILRIDLPFLDSQNGVTIISIPSFAEKEDSNVIFISEETILAYTPVRTIRIEREFEKIIKKKNGESTTTIFLLLKAILKDYSQEFLRLRDKMNSLEMNPILDSIEETGRQLRKLTDRIEGLFQIIIEFKEEDIRCFDVSLINLTYEIFSTEARSWLERSRSHVYRIASLRTKSEMLSNKELNDTMKKLTVIMTFLTIVSIVVNVPGTVGAIFGIPALSNAYFESHTLFLIITLILTTVLSLLLGFLYWKSLNLKKI